MDVDRPRPSSPTVDRSGPSVPGRLTLGAFALLVLIGGSNFVAVRYSNDDLAPLFGAGLRFGLAAMLMLGIVAATRLPLPRGRALAGALVFGVLNFGLTYAFAYVGLVRVSAGLGSVVMASVPLLTFFLAFLHSLERFRWGGLAGALIAISGIAWVSRGSLSGEAPPLYVLAVLVAALCAAEATVLVKLLKTSHPVTTNAVGMTIGTVFLLAMSLAFGETWTLPSDARTWLTLAYLVVLGSAGLFFLAIYVLKRWTASATSYALTLFPIVSIALGAGIRGESVSGDLILGGALVLAGVYVGALGRSRPYRAPTPVREPASTTVEVR